MNKANDIISGDNLTKGKRFLPEHYAFIALLLLAFVGETITTISPIVTFWYWLFMVPIFAATAIMTEWDKARREGYVPTHLILLQLAHWGGVVLALFAIYTLWKVGRLENENTGIVIMLILSYATFSDGVHCGWRFYLMGIFLFLTTIIGFYLKNLFWIAAILCIPIILFGLYWEKYHDLLPTTKRTLDR
jgi:hypothetical protein